MHSISLLEDGGIGGLEHEERVVLKFQIELGETTIPMADSGIPLMVGEQEGGLVVWVELPTDTDAPTSDRTFQVYGTGWAQRTDVCHGFLGTVISEDGYVWHVYETHQHTEDEIEAIRLIDAFMGDTYGES